MAEAENDHVMHEQITRRDLMRRGAGIASATVLAAALPRRAWAAPRRRFVIYSYGGVWDEGVKNGAVKILQRKYPDLDIVVDPSGTYPKLLAEKDNPQADVAHVDDSTMPLARAGGLLQEYDPSKVPNAAFVHEKGKLFGLYGVAMQFGRLGIAYRTDKIKKPPTSWRDLWNPEFKGRVGIAVPRGTAWINFLVSAAMLNGGGTNNIDPGFEMLRRLKPNLLTITETTAQETQLITSGDLWIQHWWDGRTLSLKRTGVPVDFVTPKEGAWAVITYICIVNRTRNADIAHDYLNAALDPEAQIAFSEALPYGPTNLKTVLPEHLRKLGVLYGKNPLDKLGLLDWEKIAPLRAPWTDKWNSIMR